MGKIDLNDYENHMSLENVYQLQVLNEMMKEQFNEYDIDTIMVLGIAGGNGLEHINKKKIKKIYGVDVNRNFLVEFLVIESSILISSILYFLYTSFISLHISATVL